MEAVPRTKLFKLLARIVYAVNIVYTFFHGLHLIKSLCILSQAFSKDRTTNLYLFSPVKHS